MIKNARLRRYLLIKPLLLIATLVLTLNTAVAAGWQTKTGKDNKGNNWASLTLKQGKYTLNLSCRQGGDWHLQMTLLGDSFPNLYAADDVEAMLNFQLDLPGGVTHKNLSKAWYYGGDKAWTGQLSVDESMLTYFAAAESMTLLNPKGGTVLVFSMDGSAVGAKAIRTACRFGDNN